MDDNKKILIIHHGRGAGGGLVALLGLIDELKCNNEVEVLSIFDDIAAQYIRKTGVNVIIPKSRFYLKSYRIFVHSAAAYFSIIDYVKNIISFILYLSSKYHFAQKELENITSDYDVVYLNSTFISDWSFASKRLKKKVVIHVREPLSRGLFGFRRAIIRNTIKKNCDHIIAITQDNCKRVDVPGKTTVVYDPVVTKDRGELEEIEIDNSCKYFLYLGGMMRIKGFEQMVECLDFLEDNIRIFFLGAEAHYHNTGIKSAVRQALDPYTRKHEYLVRKLMASKKIIQIGLTDKVFSYYNNSIALISPFSKPHAALPILEAFSLGIPAIVSDVKGMEELVDGKNGLLFKNNDPKSLAIAINEMASLPETEYKSMKAASINTYNRIRDIKNSVSSVIEKL